jgi:hypothetical protein
VYNLLPITLGFRFPIQDLAFHGFHLC